MDAVEIHDAGGPYAAKGFFYRDMKMDSLVPSDIVAWDESGISDKVLDSFEKTVQYCKKNKDVYKRQLLYGLYQRYVL